VCPDGKLRAAFPIADPDEENRYGVFSAGAIVRDCENRAIGALSGGVPSSGLTKKERSRVIRLVAAAANNASRRLGAQIDEGNFLPSKIQPAPRRKPVAKVTPIPAPKRRGARPVGA
jgi:hypothetical protein